MLLERLRISCYGVWFVLVAWMIADGIETGQSEWTDGPTTPAEWGVLGDELRRNGYRTVARDTQWRYARGDLEWWSVIRTSNWTGWEPREPQLGDGGGGGTLPPKTTGLDERVELRAIVANESDLARILIHYKDAPGRFASLAPGQRLEEPVPEVEFVGVERSGSRLCAVFTSQQGSGVRKRECLPLRELELDPEKVVPSTIAELHK